tara:strand:+ start:1199 stop:1507 length:309 start_codon:yes stop_codon:yes gene_type:complete
MQQFDNIESLPVDTKEPTPTELKIVNSLFKSNKTQFKLVLSEFKSTLILGILFIIISNSYSNNILAKYLPVLEKSEMYNLILKAFLLMLSFWLINNFYLSRK